MDDPYGKALKDLGSAALNAFEIVPNVAADIEAGIKALKIINKTTGWITVRVRTMRQDDVDIDVPGNSIWVDPIRIERVLSTTPAYPGDGTIRIFGYTDAEGNI